MFCPEKMEIMEMLLDGQASLVCFGLVLYLDDLKWIFSSGESNLGMYGLTLFIGIFFHITSYFFKAVC